MLLVGGIFSKYSATSVHAATGDITAVRIAGNAEHNGWTAEIDIEGLSTGGTYNLGLGANNDPSTAKIVFTVTSPGYDTSGNATTVTRTIYGTKEVRKAYPSEAQSDESASGGTVTLKVALSDFIYSGDTSITVDIASGFYTQAATPNGSVNDLAVTNSSTLAYPKTIGHFVVEQRRPVNGTQNIEVFAAQKFAQNSKPVAFVSVTATGATSGHVETGSATAMTLSSRGDNIPVYSIPLNLSIAAGFTRGELVNINFTAYPWVGDSSSKLDSTVDAGATIEKLGQLKWTIMDKMISVVDLSTGNDTTCVASLVQGTADASPCLTISGALTKIAAQNNTLYTLNRVDGGEVQLKAGTYKTGKYSTQAVTNGYFTLTPHSSSNRAGVIFDGYVTSQYQYAYQRYYNVTFNRAASGFIVFAANTNVLVMESVNFIDAHTGGWYSGDTNTNIEFLDNTVTNSKFSPGGNDGHSRLNRNNTYTNPTGTSQIVGNASAVIGLKGTGSASDIWTQLADGESNVLIAYTNWTSKTDGYFILGSPGNQSLSNMAIINNLVERIGVSATPLSEISDAPTISNIILWYNTYSGQRFNHENDISAPYVNRTLTNWSGKFNLFNSRGDHRADIFDTDTTMVGSWSIGYSIGWLGNHNEAIAYSGDQDFWGLLSNIDTGSDSGTSINPSAPVGYVTDKSQGGTNIGNGDYHLTASSLALSKVPSGSAVLPYDLDGNLRHNNGFGAAGAFEWDVTAPTVTDFTIPATASSLTVSASSFTATDAVGVTGYKLTESSTAPAYDASGWSGSAPSNYTFSSAGSKTLYAWAKDAVGNVSTSLNDSVVITLPTYSVGGTASGLVGTIVLQNNAGDDLTVNANGVFTFATSLSDAATYSVTILTQPTNQTCVLSNESGTIATANVTNVGAVCTTNSTGGGGFIQTTGNSNTNSTNTALAFTNIKLIVDGNTYYIIKDNKRYGVTNPGILFSYGLEFTDGTPATQADTQIPYANHLKPGDGALVKKPGESTIYLIFDNAKHGFTSESVFNALGYSFTNVLEVTANELDALPVGAVLADPNMAHPSGTFINQDGTIFRIYQNLKYGIPSMEVYNSFNLDNSFAHVVPANAQDRLLLIGAVLDKRLVK